MVTLPNGKSIDLDMLETAIIAFAIILGDCSDPKEHTIQLDSR